MLANMSRAATKLYNTALWNARKEWDETGKIPTGFELHKPVLASPMRKMVHTHTAQNQADRVWRGFKSWFTLRKTDVTAQPPGFRKKESLSAFTLTEAAFHPKVNGFSISVGEDLKRELKYPHRFLALRVAWNTDLPNSFKFKQLEIVPRKGWFEVHAKLELPEPEWKKEGQVIAVDLGETNPIVSMDEEGKVDIFKGGAIASNSRYWNKEKARVQSEVKSRSKNKRKWSKALSEMSRKGTAQKKHAIHALTSTFAKICEERKATVVVVGDLGGIKKEKDGTGKKWTKVASQRWQQFPVREVVAQLGYKLARRCIQLVEQDERGTSKGRCRLCGCTDRAKLHRLKRGLFFCGNCNSYQNADVNGVGNQLARYLHQETPEGVSEGSSGLLASPSVHRWDGHSWGVVA